MKKTRPANKIGRKRRTLGWTLLALGLLVAGVWVWSGWRVYSQTPVAASLSFQQRGDLMVDEAILDFLWTIPLLLWSPAALLLRSGILARRRAATGSCAKCGYSLAGLGAGAPCPECGKGAGTT